MYTVFYHPNLWNSKFKTGYCIGNGGKPNVPFSTEYWNPDRQEWQGSAGDCWCHDFSELMEKFQETHQNNVTFKYRNV